jgi:subtilisin family serine protease
MAKALWAAPVLLLAVGGAPAAAGAPPSPRATLAQLVQDVGGRGAGAAPQRYAYLRKIDSHLQDVAASRLGAGTPAEAAIAARRQGVTLSGQGDALADVYVNGEVDAVARDLRALGMRITAVSRRAPQRMVEGYLPPEAIASAAALAQTTAISTPLVHLNAALSQGDAAINGPEARALGPRGEGVSVGIISDSIDAVNGGIADSVNSGDLPADTAELELPHATGTDEGRAMAEIVYDEAPGLRSIRFVTANGGPATKAHGIDALVSAGVKVIADDTSYIGEPFFQDDVIAQAVDRAKAAGVAVLVSAGNDARNSWQGTFTPAPSPGANEDFDPSAAVDTMQAIGPVPAHVEMDVVLQWAEPWGHAATNLALDVYDITGGTPVLLGTSDADNIQTGLPEEFMPVVAGTMQTTFGIVIRRVAGTGSPLMKYMALTNGAPLPIEHPSEAGTIGPDSASASGALTVAASDFHNPATPEAFSSRGPVTHFFDANGSPLPAPSVRQKPELAAPDGVTTSLAAHFAPFYGTSAAAPAAAGIAALILSAKPALPIDELYAIMTDAANTLDCTASGAVPDPDCGAGFLFADSALTMALDNTPPLVTATLSPAAPDGSNGWYREPVTVTWQVSDTESPVIGPAGCAPVSLTTSASVTCSATSAGGTTTAPVTVRIDASPPSVPAFTGIGAQTYLPATLPSAKAVACTASDPTSDVTGCGVTGFGTAFGTHLLTATATNGAGLTATSTLSYVVAKPVAIAKLKLTKLRLAKLRSSGLTLTVRVAAASTRLVVKLTALVPRASGTGTRTVTIGALTKRVSAGTVTLHVRLTARGKAVLKALTRTTLKVTLAGSSAGAKSASLKSSLTVRR